MPQLKPCPFCASHDVAPFLDAVRCNSCDAQGPRITRPANLPSWAIEAWNNRGVRSIAEAPISVGSAVTALYFGREYPGVVVSKNDYGAGYWNVEVNGRVFRFHRYLLEVSV